MAGASELNIIIKQNKTPLQNTIIMQGYLMQRSTHRPMHHKATKEASFRAVDDLYKKGRNSG